MTIRRFIFLSTLVVFCALTAPSSRGLAKAPDTSAVACAKAGGHFSDIYCLCGWQTFLDPQVEKCDADEKVVYTGERIDIDFVARPEVQKKEDQKKIQKLRQLDIGKCEYANGVNIDAVDAKPGQPSQWPILAKTFSGGNVTQYCFGKVSCHRTNNNHVTVFSATCPATVTTCDAPGTCLEKLRENGAPAAALEHNIEFKIRNYKLGEPEKSSAETSPPGTGK